MDLKYVILLFIVSLTKLEGTTFKESASKLDLNQGSPLPSNTINRLEDYLQVAMRLQYFSGVVLIAHHGKVILNKGYGPANIYAQNEQNTIFHVASITKQFTAAAILKLWESGEIDLHVSINTYLPEEYKSDIWKKVTVHHLLSHTSGIIDYDDTYFTSEKKGFCFKDTVKKMIASSRRKQLEFEPGKGWHYSNIGYSLLGEILEHQAGQAYSKLIQKFFMNTSRNVFLWYS
jgi:CubicO group peptidase (beta-lactamase class C family)